MHVIGDACSLHRLDLDGSLCIVTVGGNVFNRAVLMGIIGTQKLEREYIFLLNLTCEHAGKRAQKPILFIYIHGIAPCPKGL